MKLYTLILDRSCSMSSIWDEITLATNDHMTRKAEGALTSLLLFDTEGLDFLFKYEPKPTPLDKTNFQPRGGTPLRDAIMCAIETLARDWGDCLCEAEVELTVFSDGEENSSSLWTSTDVARTISHFQDQYNWKVSFIGAGEQSDIANYAKQFGVKAENVVGYTSKEQLAGALAAV